MDTIRFYASLCAEVGDACDHIVSNPGEKICIVCGDCSGSFYSAIGAELDYRGIELDDFVGFRKPACLAALETFRHWTSWQIDRDIFAFIKFYQDLVAQEIHPFGEFDSLNKRINSSLHRFLTPNCDVIFAAIGNEKSLQNFLSQCDLGGKKVSIAKFLSRLKTILGELLPEDLSDELDAEFSPYDQTSCQNFAVLAKVAKAVFEEYGSSPQKEPGTANVAIAAPPLAARRGYDFHICSLTNCQNFDKFTEYILAKKRCALTCVAENYDGVPDFFRRRFFASTGKIFTTDDFQRSCVKRNCIESHGEIDAGVLQTKIAHDSRNDSHLKFDEYSHMLDTESMHSIACKTVELLLKNPANAFYGNVLKLECVRSWLDVGVNRKILLGSLVHELLNVGAHCRQTPTLAQFRSLIDWKWENAWKQMAGTHSAAGAEISHFTLETFHLAKYVAYKFAAKIVSLGYKFMATEVNIPPCPIPGGQLGDIKLTGRVDCIMSNENWELNSGVPVNIFDFKTSKYDVLKEEKIFAQLAEYTGIQVYMYGLAYESAGFCDVAVQILRHDCECPPPVSTKVFREEGKAIFSELARIFQSGVLGEKSAKFTSDMAELPIATSTRPNEVIENKLKLCE